MFPPLIDIPFVAGTFVSLLQLFLLYYVAVKWAWNAFPTSPMSLRVAVAMVAMFWIAGALFALLISVGLFNRTVASLALGFIALFVWLVYRKARASFLGIHSELSREICSTWYALPVLTRIFAVGTGLVFLVRFARGLIAPPLAWDALTYHLLKAGRWVQTGGWVSDNSPDAWQFYEYFPPLGDVYWAWAMLGTSSDAWLSVAGALIWMASGVGTYATARVMGANKNHSVLAGLVALSVPASLSLLTAAYVDTTAMAVIVLGSALLLSGALEKSTSRGAVGTVAMALAVGIKITFLPYLLVALVVIMWIFLVAPKGAFVSLVSSLFAVVIALSWQIYLVAMGKTPFYPAPFSVAGIEIEPGQQEFLEYVYPEKFHLPYLWEMPRSFIKFLTLADSYLPNHQNFTWTFPALLVFACVGLWKSIKRTECLPSWSVRSVRRSVPFFAVMGLFAAGAVIFLKFWAPSMASYRETWLITTGRFYLGWYGFLASCIAVAGFRWVNWWLMGLIAVNLFYSWPREWTLLDMKATAFGCCIIAGFIGGFFLVTRVYSLRIKFAVAVVSVLLLSISANILRGGYRYQFYENTDVVYDVSYLGFRFTGHAAKYLDTPSESHVINFTTGYTGKIYRWYRYPLMGSRLQNKIVYITPTADGSAWSQSVEKEKPLSGELWLERLEQAKVNAIVSLKPFARELDWIAENSAFNVVAMDPRENWVLIRK